MSYGFNMVGPNASKDPSSGNTIKVVGGGSFDTTAGTVVATGSFAEFDASGSVIAQGTWQATAFVSFVSYGGPSPGFQGGHRVDVFLRNLDCWMAKGMEGALFGIESFHQNVLKQIRKGEKAEAALELTRRLHHAGIYAHGYYIIGFPAETAASIRADLDTLASLELDVTQITIVTPHPQTQLWDELERNHGIFEKDWAKFDTKHLVWGHPSCAPGVLESLLEAGFGLCYGPGWMPRVWRKFLSRRRIQGDLFSLLFSPLRARWATPQHLPYFASM